MFKYLTSINFLLALNWIGRNPKKSLGGGLIIASPFINRWLKSKAETELKGPVYAKLLKGSTPPVPLPEKLRVIPRPEVVTDIANLCLPQDVAVTRFGVVIGPSGSGKTSIITELCNKNPQGVLYYEVRQPNSFVNGLSREIGMKITPNTALDLLLGYISQRYAHYYELPESQLSGINVVIDVLDDVSTRYIWEHKKIPVLFIDGIDVLAKYDEELCSQLVILCKVLANNDKLRVVLVSSEGTVIPLLAKLSATNRGFIYEVGDVRDDDAFRYLVRNGVQESLAEKLVERIGGRMVHLESCIHLLQTYQEDKEKDMLEKITTDLFSRILSAQHLFIEKYKPESEAILEIISEEDYIDPAKLLKDAGMEKDKVHEVLAGLIDVNILRYNVKGFVTWYGKIQATVFGKRQSTGY